MCLKNLFNVILLRNITKTSGTKSTTFSATLLYFPKWSKINHFLLTSQDSIIKFNTLKKLAVKFITPAFVIYIFQIFNNTSPSWWENIWIKNVPKYIYNNTLNLFISCLRFLFRNILRSSSTAETAPIILISSSIILVKNNTISILFSNNFYSIHIWN